MSLSLLHCVINFAARVLRASVAHAALFVVAAQADARPARNVRGRARMSPAVAGAARHRFAHLEHVGDGAFLLFYPDAASSRWRGDSE